MVVHHLGLAHGLAVQAFRGSGPGRIGPCLVAHPGLPGRRAADDRQAGAVTDAWENTLYLDPVLKRPLPEAIVELRSGRPARAASRDPDSDLADHLRAGGPARRSTTTHPSSSTVRASRSSVTRSASDGWQQIHADGLYDVLVRLHRDYDVAD